MTVPSVNRTASPLPPQPTDSRVDEHKFAAAAGKAAALQEGDPIPKARSTKEIKDEYYTRFRRHLDDGLAKFLSGEDNLMKHKSGKEWIQVLDAASLYGFDELALIDKVNDLWQTREATRQATDDASSARFLDARNEINLIFGTIDDNVKVKTEYLGLGTSYFHGLKDFANFVRRTYPALKTTPG
jgi:hypothetical protein